MGLVVFLATQVSLVTVVSLATRVLVYLVTAVSLVTLALVFQVTLEYLAIVVF